MISGCYYLIKFVFSQGKFSLFSFSYTIWLDSKCFITTGKQYSLEICPIITTVIKGKVLLIDEQNTMLAYTVEVVRIIQQGNKDLRVGQQIELWKRGVCQSPDLKENKEYLFMGLDKGDRYELDKKSFVKLWPRSPDNNKDKVILEDFAAQYTC